MSSAAVPPPLPSAGRRRPKNLPSLPLSAFSPPNTGTSDMFPMPPTPSAVFPDTIVDAHAVPATLAELRSEGAQLLADKVSGIVLRLDDDVGTTSEDVERALEELQTDDLPVLSVLVPFALAAPAPAGGVPASTRYPTTLYTTFDADAPASALPDTAAGTLRWALQSARAVDIDVRGDVMSNDAADRFVALLTDATEDMQASPPTIVLSNICPPPHDLTLPIVKLMNHATYRAYQAQTATLSFFPKLHIKFTPPTWGAALPARGTPGEEGEEALEWKRRIKMYIGPVLEAFGYERILFGSAPSPASTTPAGLADWYALVRESFAELAVEQEAIDAIFAGNAKRVYGGGAAS